MTPALAAHVFSAAVLALWALAAGFVPPYVLPSPPAVGSRILELFTTDKYLMHGLASALHVVAALAAAFAIGMLLAGAAYYLAFTRLLVHERVNRFMNSFSALGWTFLAIIWFGINDFTVVFAMTAVLLPLVITNLREGFHQMDAEIIEMAASFGRRRIRHFTKITLLLLVPYVAATLRITFGVAWIISLTVELFGGAAGYGFLLNRARMEYRIDMIFAIIAVIIMVVYATDRFAFSPLQDRLRRQYAGQA
ncbi:MAG: ABC transporter permease subunit [Betaproteobacteria bacterium]|nr:ABC transporter permease subunit [Betaproteobacteria bacterium]